ncbi:MAG: hypothetical protein U1F77_12825 [Kiritimatiellia bacterium]
MKTPAPIPLLVALALSAGAAPIPPEIEKIREIPEPIRAESLKRSGMNTGLDDGLYSPALRADPKAGRNMEALARGQAFLEAMEAQDEAVAATVPPEPPPGTNDNVRVEIMRRVQEEGTQIPVEPAPGIADLPAGVDWSLKGNSELRGKGFLGTLDRSPLRLGVNGQTAIQIISTPFSPSLVMGGAVNFVGEGIAGVAISGGGDQFFPNRVMGDYGVVSGGLDTRPAEIPIPLRPFCVVAGGRAPGGTAQLHGGRRGGQHRAGSARSSRAAATTRPRGSLVPSSAAPPTSSWPATASSRAAAPTGWTAGPASSAPGSSTRSRGCRGWSAAANTPAAAPYSTVPGGSNNRAAGKFSFAAGRLAQALHEGAFVWSDGSSKEAFASTAANQFLIRASGNVGIDNPLPQENCRSRETSRRQGGRVDPRHLRAALEGAATGRHCAFHGGPPAFRAPRAWWPRSTRTASSPSPVESNPKPRPRSLRPRPRRARRRPRRRPVPGWTPPSCRTSWRGSTRSPRT